MGRSIHYHVPQMMIIPIIKISHSSDENKIEIDANSVSYVSIDNNPNNKKISHSSDESNHNNKKIAHSHLSPLPSTKNTYSKKNKLHIYTDIISLSSTPSSSPYHNNEKDKNNAS